ncbi:hypothetical protein H0H92_004892 [Tricholoma furcatifolium]|nr:hypothetical protein H0H92_004892 [Tricholoma furcatifolium]
MPRCFAPECDGRLFPNREALQQHLRSSGRPHPVCIPCDRRFISHKALYEHATARHPPTYQCLECDREFRSESALKDHYRGSPPDRHPNCPKCGEGFRDVAERDKHAEHHNLFSATSSNVSGTVLFTTPVSAASGSIRTALSLMEMGNTSVSAYH